MSCIISKIMAGPFPFTHAFMLYAALAIEARNYWQLRRQWTIHQIDLPL